jgi:hypothetical protein
MDTISKICHTTGKYTGKLTSSLVDGADHIGLKKKVSKAASATSSACGTGYEKVTGRDATTDTTIAKVTGGAVAGVMAVSAAATAVTIATVGAVAAGTATVAMKVRGDPDADLTGAEKKAKAIEKRREGSIFSTIGHGLKASAVASWKVAKTMGSELKAGFNEEDGYNPKSKQKEAGGDVVVVTDSGVTSGDAAAAADDEEPGNESTASSSASAAAAAVAAPLPTSTSSAPAAASASDNPFDQ